MCEKYCGDKTTIILCVMQANVDISTSEALHMARRLDPEGNRTVGVLTKLDLMDPGTSAKTILEGQEVALKNGYIALKNRSQQDLIDRLPVKVAIEKEMMFFRSHTVYSKMNSNFFGIENLVDKLRRLFFDHLKMYLPGIYSSLKEKIQECKKCLEELGATDLTLLLSSGSDMSYLNGLINKFSQSIENIFAGKSFDLEDNKTSHTLKLLYYEFLETLASKPPSKNFHNRYIMEIIVRSEGDRLSGFPESTVFYEILNDQYETIKQEIQSFYERIYEEVIKSFTKTNDRFFKHFPQLKDRMFELSMEFVDKNFNNAKYICDSIAEMNMNYMYIDEDERFESILLSILTPEDTKEAKDSKGKPVKLQRSLSEKNDEHNEKLALYVKKMVDYYYGLTIRNLRESIPKAMAFNFIREMKNLRAHLLLQLVSMGSENLLQEDPMIADKRKYYTDILKILEKSEKMMLADDE